MIHKRLQTDIVRKDRLCSLAHTTVATSGVGRGRVEFGEEETGLGSASVADDEARKREAVLDQFL
jgi:hypothetical protein